MMRYLPITAVMMLLQTAAFAQGYPLKPIRIIVPYPPGSAPDFTAREVGAL